MQRRIGNQVQLGKPVYPLDSKGGSSSIDRTASNFTNANENANAISYSKER